MAINVFRVLTVRDGQLVEDGRLPRGANLRIGALMAVFANLSASPGGGGPAWEVPVVIGTGRSQRSVRVPVQDFLSAEEYRESTLQPFSLVRLREQAADEETRNQLNTLWIYRDTFYVSEHIPTASEIEEVTLRIKAMQYRRDEDLKRLREEVANFEAIERQSFESQRRPIPDDVKLLVWTRDKGVCVKCGGGKELHFDHVIPLSRGGSDEAVNIQLLCRTCNLAKGGRIV